VNHVGKTSQAWTRLWSEARDERTPDHAMQQTGHAIESVSFSTFARVVQSTVRSDQGEPAMPPNEVCPNCHRQVADWHLERYKTEGQPCTEGRRAGLPVMSAAGRVPGGKIGPPPAVPLVKRNADQAAVWAASQAVSAEGRCRATRPRREPGLSTQTTGARRRPASRRELPSEPRGTLRCRCSPRKRSHSDVFPTRPRPHRSPGHTKALHQCGVEYGDISYIAWRMSKRPRSGFTIGHPADVSPPLPGRPAVRIAAESGTPANLGAKGRNAVRECEDHP
jgi:hypothetical protein